MAPESEVADELRDDREAAGATALSDRLWSVGGVLPLDGRASWMPTGLVGFQPCHTYVLRTVAEILIVDPGLPLLWDDVSYGLRSVVAVDAKPRIFLTRSQLDCSGNLSGIERQFAVQEIFTGGLRNPFDSFDDATAVGGPGSPGGQSVQRSPADSQLEVYSPALRLLATFWGYDSAARVLFTSDSFTHNIMIAPDDARVVDSKRADVATEEDVRAHLLATFWWLRYADTEAIVSDLSRFFAEHPVEIIAPCRGCVIKGTELVERHVDMVLRVLSSFPLEDL